MLARYLSQVTHTGNLWYLCIFYQSNKRNIADSKCRNNPWEQVIWRLETHLLTFPEVATVVDCRKHLGYILDKACLFHLSLEWLNVHQYLLSPIICKETTPSPSELDGFFHWNHQAEVLANEMQQRSTWKNSWSSRSTLGWSGCHSFGTGDFWRCANVICQSWRFEIWAEGLRLVGLIFGSYVSMF